jgi:hypothetical protein
VLAPPAEHFRFVQLVTWRVPARTLPMLVACNLVRRVASLCYSGSSTLDDNRSLPQRVEDFTIEQLVAANAPGSSFGFWHRSDG